MPLSQLVRLGWANSFRYGEKTTPFCVTLLEGKRGDGEFSRRINNAVERATSDYHSGTSSDEEGPNISMTSSSSGSSGSSSSSSSSSGSSSTSTLSAPEPAPKCIPTVSNPNSVYQVFLHAVSQPFDHFRNACLVSNMPTSTQNMLLSWLNCTNVQDQVLQDWCLGYCTSRLFLISFLCTVFNLIHKGPVL